MVCSPFGLLPAYQLYENSTYNRLVDRFGLSNVYILSAGWGLIPADFLTPHYDITFSASADAYKRPNPGIAESQSRRLGRVGIRHSVRDQIRAEAVLASG